VKDFNYSKFHYFRVTDFSFMVRKYFRNIALFFAIWLAVMLVYAITHGVRDADYMWKFFLLPALFLGLVAALATSLELLFKVKKGINWFFLLGAVAVDQGIKTYLFSLDWESISIPLIEPVFYIEPTQNTLGSYLWVLLGFKQGSHLVNIILFSLIGVVFIEVWRFYVLRKRNSFWINGFIHLFLAGLAANLIDNAFWGGSLDYVTIKPFYTFDLKDLYITLCELFLVTELVDNRLLKRFLNMPRKESRQLNRDFMEFVKRDFRIGKKEDGDH
jgi:signal peptidase II